MQVRDFHEMAHVVDGPYLSMHDDDKRLVSAEPAYGNIPIDDHSLEDILYKLNEQLFNPQLLTYSLTLNEEVESRLNIIVRNEARSDHLPHVEVMSEHISQGYWTPQKTHKFSYETIVIPLDLQRARLIALAALAFHLEQRGRVLPAEKLLGI